MSDDNAAAARTPADFLKSIKGKPVVVKLNSGVDYRGTAAGAYRLFVYQAEHMCHVICRDSRLLRWLHEHRDGANRGNKLQTYDTISRSDVASIECMLQEYVQGQLKNRYGDAFILGNNGTQHDRSCTTKDLQR